MQPRQEAEMGLSRIGQTGNDTGLILVTGVPGPLRRLVVQRLRDDRRGRAGTQPPRPRDPDPDRVDPGRSAQRRGTRTGGGKYLGRHPPRERPQCNRANRMTGYGPVARATHRSIDRHPGGGTPLATLRNQPSYGATRTLPPFGAAISSLTLRG